MTKVPALIDKARQKAEDLGMGKLVEPLLKRVEDDLKERRKRLHENLAKDLVAACGLKNLDLRVIRREEPVEVRIPPFGVTIDRSKGLATLHFARKSLVECAANADDIVSAHQEAKRSFGGNFNGQAFFGACRKAWSAACGAGEAGTGERVELLDFLPYLALFAFDVMQLRNQSGFTQDGWRFNLGVATGTTASKKDRSIFFEDENGNGEFKLTVFFVREEASR
jgi:hypothetical protein